MAIRSGTKTVTSAGTRVQLSSTWAHCTEIAITALDTNTDNITVGDDQVVAAAVGRRGMGLGAGQTEYLKNVNLTSIYIDSLVSGEGVSWVATSEM